MPVNALKLQSGASLIWPNKDLAVAPDLAALMQARLHCSEEASCNLRSELTRMRTLLKTAAEQPTAVRAPAAVDDKAHALRVLSTWSATSHKAPFLALRSLGQVEDKCYVRVVNARRALQVEQLRKAAADGTQAAARAEAAREKAQAEVARKEGILEELRTQLDSAMRHAQDGIWSVSGSWPGFDPVLVVTRSMTY